MAVYLHICFGLMVNLTCGLILFGRSSCLIYIRLLIVKLTSYCFLHMPLSSYCSRHGFLFVIIVLVTKHYFFVYIGIWNLVLRFIFLATFCSWALWYRVGCPFVFSIVLVYSLSSVFRLIVLLIVYSLLESVTLNKMLWDSAGVIWRSDICRMEWFSVYFNLRLTVWLLYSSFNEINQMPNFT